MGDTAKMTSNSISAPSIWWKSTPHFLESDQPVDIWKFRDALPPPLKTRVLRDEKKGATGQNFLNDL